MYRRVPIAAVAEPTFLGGVCNLFLYHQRFEQCSKGMVREQGKDKGNYPHLRGSKTLDGGALVGRRYRGFLWHFFGSNAQHCVGRIYKTNYQNVSI